MFRAPQTLAFEPTLLRAPSQQVFYHTLVDWNRVDTIVFLTNPADHPQVRQLVLETLDHVVMETILVHLPRPHHEVFLEICVERFADPEVLMWLEEKAEGISVHIEQALVKTKDELHAMVVSL